LQLIGGCFNIVIKLKHLTSEEISNVMQLSGLSSSLAKGMDNIPIKQLLMVIDMARRQNPNPTYSEISECYEALKSTDYDLDYHDF